MILRVDFISFPQKSLMISLHILLFQDYYFILQRLSVELGIWLKVKVYFFNQTLLFLFKGKLGMIVPGIPSNDDIKLAKVLDFPLFSGDPQ